MDLQDLVGRKVVVGVTLTSPRGRLRNQEQFHGEVESVTADAVTVITPTGKSRFLPPQERWFQQAEDGVEYALKNTGEVVSDVDYIAIYVIREPTLTQRVLGRMQAKWQSGRNSNSRNTGRSGPDTQYRSG